MEFEFKGFKLRCFELDGDGEIWFVAKDIATILGYKNDRDAISKHTSESDRKRLIYKACRDSRQAKLWSGNDFSDKVLINESGLYCMIFGSKLESAQEFKRWVTKEVLPSIRKNGGYVLDQEYLSPKQQELVIEKLVALSKIVKVLKQKNAFLQKRRHELIAEGKTLKAKKKEDKEIIRKLNKTIDILNKDADDSFKILDRTLDDLEAANNKVRSLKEIIASNNIPTTAPAIDNGPVYTIDKYGMVSLKCS